MTWPEIITTIKDILLGIAGATTAIVAVKGLHSWRRELKGKTEFEAARNLIRATYKLRDELNKCRAPFISASEFPEKYSPMNASPQEEAEAYGHIYKNRWEPVANAVQEFDTHTLEAEALWGKEIRPRTNLFCECISELYIAIMMVIRDKASDGRNFEKDKDFAREMNSKLFALRDEQNEFSEKIKTATSEIENYIRPHLRRD